MKSVLFAFLLVLACSATAGTEVYKWVDKDGVVHYGDEPPEDTKSEKLTIESAPSIPATTRPGQVHEQMMDRVKQRKEARESSAAAREAAAKKRQQQQQQCSYARQQLISLQQELPVYRDEEGRYRTLSLYDAYEGERKFLDDTSRARAIQQVRLDIENSCEDPDDSKENLMAAWERHKLKRCETARADLAAALRPEAKSPRQTIEDARDLVARYCESSN
jgi:hypothetical protein